MMAGLGKALVVNLVAITDKFRKGMNDAKGILGGFSSTIKSTVGVLTRFKTMLAGVAAAAGVGLSISALTSNIAKLAGVADEAAKTGLSGAFIQRLGYAADQSGVSAEVLTQAVKKLTINVGSGSKAFAELGLNLAALQAMSPEEQFKAVAAKISDIPTAAGRAAAAVKLFGRSGVDLAGMFAGGSEEIAKLMNDAQQLGIGLSEEMLARAAKADDSIQRMKSTFAALWDQITISLAPAIEDLATKIGNLIPPMTEVLNKWNAMPQQWEFLGNLIVATMDVAFEEIKVLWFELLNDMKTGGIESLKSWMPKHLQLAVGLGQAIAPANAAPVDRAGADAAQGRLKEVMDELNRGIGGAAAGGELKGMAPEQFDRLKWLDKMIAQEQQTRALMDKIKASGPLDAEAAKLDAESNAAMKKFTDERNALLGKKGAAAGGEGSAIGDLLSGAGSGLLSGFRGMFDRTKIKAGAWGNMLGAWLGSDRPEAQAAKPEPPPRLAAAMARGSVEAYSTIVQAMVTRGKDPVVKATEKGSKDIVKAVKESKPVFNLIEAFGF